LKNETQLWPNRCRQWFSRPQTGLGDEVLKVMDTNDILWVIMLLLAVIAGLVWSIARDIDRYTKKGK